MARKIESLFYELRARTEGLQADLQGAERQFGKLATFIDNNPTASALALGAALAGVAAKASAMALQLDREMRSVRTVIDQTTISAEQLSAGVLKVFANLPIASTGELARALYDIGSAGVQGAESLRVLEVAAKAAVAGSTDASTAAKAITAVMAAYSDAGLSVEETADKLVQAGNIARLEFGELASLIGQVTPVAAAYGISIDEVGAALTVLTGNGLSASSAITGLRSAIGNIVKPTDEFAKAFPQLAREFTATRLEGDGLVKFLRDFDKASQGSKAALTSLFSDTEGRTAALSLLKDGGDKLTEALGKMAEAAGAADRGVRAIGESASAANDVLRNRLDATLTELGNKSLPVLNVGLRALIALLDRLGEAKINGDLFSELGRALGGAAVDAARSGGDPVTSFTLTTPDRNRPRPPREAPPGKTAEELERLRKQAEAAAERVATFVRGVARDVAQAAGDEITVVKQQLKDLEEEAAKARKQAKVGGKPVDEALVAQRRQQLEDQRKLLEVAQAAAAFEARVAKEQETSREKATRDAEKLLQLAKSAREEILFIGSPTVPGLPVPTDEDLANLAKYAEQLERVARSIFVDPEVQKKAAEAAKQIRDTIRHFVGGDAPSATDPKKARDWAAEISRGARALLDAAGAAGLLDASMASALNSAVNLAESIGQIAKGNVTAIPAALAAALNIGQQLFGKTDRQRQIEATDAENRRAIAALVRAVGDLAGLSVSGGTFTRVRDALPALLGNPQRNREFLEQSRRVGGAADFFAARGLSMQEVEDVARTLGVTLDGTVESFQRLNEAARAADFRAFVDSWVGAMAQLDVLLDVDNIDNPLGQLQALGKTALGANSPVLAAILNGRDLSTAQGRSEARVGARQLLDDFMAGRLDPSALGALNPEQFLEFVRRFINGIDAVEEGLADAAKQAEEDAAKLRQAEVETIQRQVREHAQALADGAVEAARKAEEARTKLVANTLGAAQGRSAIHDADAIGQLRDLAEGYAKLSPAIAGLLRGLDLSTAGGVAALDRAIRQLFDGLEEGSVVANLGSLTIDELRDALVTLEGAGDAAAESIRNAADALADAAHQATQSRLQMLATRNGALGLDPNLNFNQALALAGKDPLLAPYLDGVTSGGGVQKAFEKFLTEVFDPARLDQYTPEELAKFNGSLAGFQQLLGFIPSSLTLPAANTPGFLSDRAIAVGAANLTERTGVDIASLFRSGVLIAQAQLDELRLIRAALAPVITAPLLPPPLAALGGFAGAGGAGAAPIHVVVTIQQIVVGAGVAADAATAYAQGFGDGYGQGAGGSLNAHLGGSLRFAFRNNGDRTVNGRTS